MTTGAPGQRIAARLTDLGEGLRVRRALPTAARRLIGAWCFLDHFGPFDTTHGRGMRVGPHPHMGLQTVTWLLDGAMLHRDSLGTVQTIRPGQLNLMTSGRGISHSEESPAERPGTLHGVQLWIALPEAERRRAPAFEHHPALPVIGHDGATVTVLMGEALSQRSPASAYSPLVALELELPAAAQVLLPLREEFEHGVIVESGAAVCDGEALAVGTLLYLGVKRSAVRIASAAGARVLLVGGVPFGEPTLMWWNFVGRTRDEVARATDEWNAGAGRFGEVHGYDGERLTAPPPPRSLVASSDVVSYP